MLKESAVEKVMLRIFDRTTFAKRYLIAVQKNICMAIHMAFETLLNEAKELKKYLLQNLINGTLHLPFIETHDLIEWLFVAVCGDIHRPNLDNIMS